MVAETVRRIAPLVALAFLTLAADGASAGDWPQILGPQRNGIAPGETLPANWPAAGPPQVWKYATGMGFSGPVVAAGRVILFHRVDDKERVESLDAATGKQQWQVDLPARYRGGINPDLGPRATPVIHDQHVYVYGAAGDLHCLRLSDGRKRWSRQAAAEYGARDGYFGAGSTPLVAGKLLLVNVGGDQTGAGLVAFDLRTGKTAWKATSEAASYSSPILTTLNGKPHAIFITRLNAVAVDPASGKEYFRFPFGRRGPTVNAATPLLIGNRLFLTASYRIGAQCLQLGKGEPTEIWANDSSMSSQYSTCIHHQGFLYGTHGREDAGRAALRCVELATGKVRWSEPDFGVAHVIRAGDEMLALSFDGRLTRVKLNPEKYARTASASVLGKAGEGGITRALPALAHGRLYLRENNGRAGTLSCWQVGPAKP